MQRALTPRLTIYVFVQSRSRILRACVWCLKERKSDVDLSKSLLQWKFKMPSIHHITGRTILITGASQGIGRSIALAFAQYRPANLILFARSTEKLGSVATEITQIDSSIRIIPKSVDVSSSKSVNDAVVSSLEVIGNSASIDVVVNNAGLAIGAPRSFPELAIDEIDTMVTTNVNGYMYVTHCVLNAGGMMKNKDGVVLNISSTTGLEVPPFPGEAVYHTSKAAQEAFSNVLRTELQGTNIKVLVLRPGVVANTNFHELRVGHSDGKDLYDNFMKGIEPLNPDSIAEAAVWMLSTPDAVSVKAIDIVPSAQRSLQSFDRTWNERNGKKDVKMGE